jgi:predicted enzyme related to lactoylglutathione lyase
MTDAIARFEAVLKSYDGRTYAVRDLDLAIAEVEHAGGRVISRGEHGPGHPFVYLADPDGYVIEL